MTCELAEKVSQLIDGELTSLEAREVERHLLSCSACQEVRTDFLSLRSRISDYAPSPLQAAPRLAHLLTPRQSLADRPLATERWLGALGLRRLNPLLATAALASFLFVCGIAVVLHFRSQRNSSTADIAQNQPKKNSTPAPLPSATASPSPRDLQKAGGEQSSEQSQSPAKFQLREAVTTLTPRTSGSGKRTRSNASDVAGRSEATTEREETASEMSADLMAQVGAADTETLTAQHVGQSEMLLRSFRNLRPGSGAGSDDLGYERRRAQQLFYQNVMLRREADSVGDVQVATLLESLEPILLDIANLPKRAPGSEVQAIKDRVERQSLVALLQINTHTQARANY
jgi:hypothetical protein